MPSVSRVLGLRGHHSGLTCVEVRLKETKTINCGNASTNALLTHAYTMPHIRRDSPLGLRTQACPHPSMLYAVRLAIPCEQHARASHLHESAAAFVPMSGHALAYTQYILCHDITPYPYNPPLREERTPPGRELFSFNVCQCSQLFLC